METSQFEAMGSLLQNFCLQSGQIAIETRLPVTRQTAV